MRELNGNTRIRLSQIDWTPFAAMVLDKHSKYRPGDRAIWKSGTYVKTHHGWQKVSDETDRNGNKVEKIKGVEKLSDNDFYHSEKSFLLPPINVGAWNKTVPETLRKPLLLKRNIIQLQNKKHKEFIGQDKNILHIALTKGNVAKFNKPNEKPNYCVIARSGHYWYWATIDTDPTKKYNEVVDWRKVNESKIKEDMKK